MYCLDHNQLLNKESRSIVKEKKKLQEHLKRIKKEKIDPD